jgi:hypothetical protein
MSKLENPSRDIELLQDSVDEKLISSNSRSIMEKALRNVHSRQLALPLGFSSADFRGDWVLLATVLVDDSPSMQKNAEIVRVGQNTVIEALLGSSNSDNVLIRTELLNAGPVSRFTTLQDAVRLDKKNYSTDTYGGTPLYKRSVEVLSTLQTTTQEFRNDWKTVRTATLIMTDGEDTASTNTPQDVCQVITDMKETNMHLIAGMAIPRKVIINANPMGSVLNGDIFGIFFDIVWGLTVDPLIQKATFKKDYTKKVLLEMGIDEKWILNPDSSADDIRTAFGLFAKAASKAVDLNGFPALMAGGFNRLRD